MSLYDAQTRELTRLLPRGDGLAARVQSERRSTRGSVQVGPNETESPRPSVRLVDPVTLEDEPVQLGGIPERADPGHPHYSADGRFMVVSFGLEGGDAVVVWDLESPQRPVRRVDVPGGRRGRPEPRRQRALRRPPRSRCRDRVRCCNRTVFEQHTRAGRLVGGEPRWFLGRSGRWPRHHPPRRGDAH